MKSRLKLIDSYKTPDEWKSRAKKIAQGKGIYARVKTNNVWKIAIAAAVALALSIEGFFLWKGTKNDEGIETVPTAPESVADDKTAQFYVRQILSKYYPNADESGLEALSGKYKNTGCGLIYTRDNGIAQSDSLEIAENITELAKADPYAFAEEDYEVVCEGYLLEENTLTALVKFKCREGNLGQDYERADVMDRFTPHVCIYDKKAGREIEPKSVNVKSINGYVGWYVRIETSLSGRLPDEGYDDIIADVHLYPKIYVQEYDEKQQEYLPIEIKNTNDVHYGYYHMDIKIEPSEESINVSNEGDVFDILRRYVNGYAAAYNVDYYSNNITTDIVKGTGMTGKDTERLTRNDLKPGEESGYAYSTELKCEGVISDGISARLMVLVRGVTSGSVDEVCRHLSTQAYLMPEGTKINCYICGLLGGSDGTSIAVDIPPQYKLAGKTIEIHVVSDGERYPEDSAHYVFTVGIPDTEPCIENSESLTWTADDGVKDHSNSTWTYRTFLNTGAKAYSSPMGTLITGADEVCDEHIKAVKASEVEDMPYVYLEMVSPEWGTFTWQGFGSDYDDYTYYNGIYKIKNEDGSSAGYYVYYDEIFGAAPDKIAFGDEKEIVKKYFVDTEGME